MTTIQSINSNQLYISQNAEVSLKLAGNTAKVTFTAGKNKKCPIKNLSKDEFVDLSTGEVKKRQHSENRFQSPKSVRKSINSLMDLIRCNASNPANCKWITQTYQEEMTDCKRVFKDNKAFLRKLRSYLKKQELSESKSDFKFIVEAVPQGENHDNSWHIHLLLIFDSKAPYISNQDISDLWGYGITDTHKVYDADTLALYFRAYLSDVEYVALNRVTSYTDYNGKTVKYFYDELRNLIALTYPGGEIVRYAYYKNGLLYSATDPEGKVTTYEYDQRGNLTKTVRPNGTVEECTYNASGLLVEQVETAAAAEGGEETELLHYRYSYDDYGNVKAVDGAKTLNTAEGISRLTSVRMTYDAANRLLTYNGEEVRYDADGNMVYGPVNGEMGTLTYDCRNRLVSAGGVTYGYDPENVRISAETDSYREEYVTESVSGSLSRVLVMTRYEKTDGADGNSAVSGTGVETIYVYGNGLISEKTGDRELWHHYNNLGSTVLLTNELGQPVAEYTYGAYGELLSGDASFTRFLYNGRCGVSTDANGLYYMRQRYYNVDIRRFINQDIITGNLANSQSLNRYAYVQGNPVKYTDPFGLSPEDGGNKGGNFWHSLLCFVGMIPGPIGAVANAVDAGIYLSEGNYAMAAMCALDAVIPAAGAVGKALAGTCKYARIGREIATGAKVANTVFNLSRGMYNADRVVGSFCERHKDDLFTDKFRWTKADTADLASFGLSSLTCFISGKSLAKDLDDFMAASTDLATLGSSVGCFVAGTTVKTEEGDKAIEEIKAGDKVLSYEATTGRFAYKEVAEVIVHDGVTELAHVTIRRKAAADKATEGEIASTETVSNETVISETIDSTTNHPYFVVGYGYVDAGNLIEGDTVLLANGKEAKVEKVEIEFLTEPVTVYNFEVKDWHCYFVGEAGVLVHNSNSKVCKNVAQDGGNPSVNGSETKNGKSKTGPKPKGTGPHNLKIEEIASQVKDGKIIAGGGRGYPPEAKIQTIAGKKSQRRPDILVKRADDSLYGINVGKTTATGAPIKREVEALYDLEDAGIPMWFIGYDK